MTDTITISGIVATEPEYSTAASGIRKCTFRIASTAQKKTDAGWESINTNWYRIICFNSLAQNVYNNFTKGSKAFISGKLFLKEYTPENGTKKVNPEIIAHTAGHDLNYTPKGKEISKKPANHAASIHNLEPIVTVV